MNNVVIFVQQKFTVVNEEQCAQFHAQVFRSAFDDPRIFAGFECLL